MGIMGQPMAQNLLNKGNKVMVYNRTREKTDSLAQAGALVASTPAELANWSDVLIMMLTGPDAIDNMLFGATGILAAENPAHIIINMSTVSPAYTKYLNIALEEETIILIDAPVSGSKKPAEEGLLVVLASGPEEKVTELDPLFMALGKKVVYCGEAGLGSCMKMTINLLLSIMMEGLCEALNLGERCGLPAETILDTVLSGPLGCGLFNLKEPMLKSNDYPPQFPLKHMAKDLRFVMQTADEIGAATPLGHALFQLYRQGLGRDLGDMDFAAVKKVLDGMNDT